MTSITPPDPSTSASPEFQRMKDGMRATWMAGDFGVIARTIASAGAAFAKRLALPAGSKVLDVATGTGNVAVPLAQAGCLVTGVDIAPNLLEQARARAAGEHLSIAFDEGDAEQLPYADGSFDAVVTMFGAMFAPRPERVAAEFARVLKPGGFLGMANWNPTSFSGAMFRTGSKHVPPPPGVPPPVLWGEEPTAHARLSGGFSNIQTELISMDFDLAVSPAGAVELFRTYFGPTKIAFERLDESGKAAFAADLETLWTSANAASDPEHHTLVHNQYLQVTATKT